MTTSSTFCEASRVLPKKAALQVPRKTPSRAAAKVTVPKGRNRSAAAQPSKPRVARKVVPKGRTAYAPEAPSPQQKAGLGMPKGRIKRASAAPITSREATVLLPKGQAKDAPETPIAAAAIETLPKGRPRSAQQQPSSVAGQQMIANQVKGAMPATPSHDSDSHMVGAEKAVVPLPPESPFDVAGQRHPAHQASLPVPAASIQSLRELHRQRQDFHRAEKSLTLQMKAVCRRLCDGDKDAGNALFAAPDDRVDMLVGPFMQARSILESNRKATEKAMERLAKELPAVSFVESVHGFGIGSLAAVVGECGDLSNYSTHSKLWKRMGLAPLNGKAMATWRSKGGLTSDQWQEAGYSPSRRSIAWNIGACVMKAQSAKIDKETGEVLKPAGPYRVLYDQRKELELTRCETKGHANARALRYLDKRILRDLWKAWRKISEGQWSGA